MTDFFITLYTDASMRDGVTTTVAWRGKCNLGTVEGAVQIMSHDIHHAEMSAMLYGIRDALARWPDLVGVFVNSDNLNCVQAFWTFRDFKTPGPAVGVKKDIEQALAGRWIRTKHVKGHSGRGNIRSYMNWSVDRMTRKAVPRALPNVKPNSPEMKKPG